MPEQISQHFIKIRRVVVPTLFIVITIWSIFTFYLIFFGWPLDKASANYAELNIPAFLNTKTNESLQEIASPELMSSLSDEKINLLLYNLSSLGRLQWNSRFIGNATVVVGGTNKAKYEAIATFEVSHANIVVELVQHDDKWSVYRLDIIVPVEGEERALSFSIDDPTTG